MPPSPPKKLHEHLRALPPHPATVVQSKRLFGGVVERLPHPATVARKRASSPEPNADESFRHRPFPLSRALQRMERGPHAFAQIVNQMISERFGVKWQAPLVKMHDDSDFVVSSFAQIAEFGEVRYTSLPLEKDGFKVKKHQMDAFRNLAIGTNGLTVGDGENKTVHILNNKNWPSTLIHESLHFYSHPDFAPFFGKDLDEGTTELFAREIMKLVDTAQGSNLSGTRGKVYTHEVDLAGELIDTFDRARIKNAYFKGEVKPIRDLILAGFAAKALKKEWRSFKNSMERKGEAPPFWKLLP